MKYKMASDKWMAIAEGKGCDKGSDNCSLCEEHNDGNSCNECPVKKETGENDCYDTPWEKWRDHQEWAHGRSIWDDGGNYVSCTECQLLALDEWLYLKSIGQ